MRAQNGATRLGAREETSKKYKISPVNFTINILQGVVQKKSFLYSLKRLWAFWAANSICRGISNQDTIHKITIFVYVFMPKIYHHKFSV